MTRYISNLVTISFVQKTDIFFQFFLSLSNHFHLVEIWQKGVFRTDRYFISEQLYFRCCLVGGLKLIEFSIDRKRRRCLTLKDLTVKTHLCDSSQEVKKQLQYCLGSSNFLHALFNARRLSINSNFDQLHLHLPKKKIYKLWIEAELEVYEAVEEKPS